MSEGSIPWESLEEAHRQVLEERVAAVMGPDTDPAEHWAAMGPAHQREWLWQEENPDEAAGAYARELARLEAEADPATQEVFDREAIPSISPRTARNRATPPPRLVYEQGLLTRFAVAARRCGLVGERATAQLLYLSVTSRFLDKPVSVGVKGHSSSGKSFVVEITCGFFPSSAVLEMTAMSEHALVYSPESFKHRMLVLYEVVALREGVEDNQTAYFVRSLLSEGRIDYPVTVRDKENGGFTTKHIVKQGPTGLIFTTTKAHIHRENETRVLSVTSDDSRAQTARVLIALAADAAPADRSEWIELQDWIWQYGEWRVVIPYAEALAREVPPLAVRLRRDFGALLSLIKAHAILHQCSRERDELGRIVADLSDYKVVARLVAPLIAEGVEATVSPATRETVGAVAAMLDDHRDGVPAAVVAARLELDKSNVSRRLHVAGLGGWLVNREDRKGRAGRWVLGEPLPEDRRLLHTVARLRAVVDGRATAGKSIDPGPDSRNPEGLRGCAVAWRDTESEEP